MSPSELTADIKAAARQLGFDLVGVAPAVPAPGYPSLVDWVAQGFAGEMSYLERRLPAYAHPDGVMSGTVSVVALAQSYTPPENETQEAGTAAQVARYARISADYHDLLRERLHALGRRIKELRPGSRTRGVVDTAPLLERDFARLAGLGWFGKNTLLINKRLGSWLFLAAMLVDFELEYDEPHAAAHCGTCTRCLDACPTGAFPAPYVLDARRCISYLTIELRGPIPTDLRPGVGDWLFGCDVCQEVCPWIRKAPPASDPAFRPQPDLQQLDPVELLSLDAAQVAERFGHTPLARPGRAGLLRNAAIVLGNRRDPQAVPALTAGLHDAEPLVRGACAWALGRLGTPAAREALVTRRSDELDEAVLQEIAVAIQEIASVKSDAEP